MATVSLSLYPSLPNTLTVTHIPLKNNLVMEHLLSANDTRYVPDEDVFNDEELLKVLILILSSSLELFWLDFLFSRIYTDEFRCLQRVID